MRCLIFVALCIAAAVSALPIQNGLQARSEDITTLSQNTPTERRGNYEGDGDKPAELFHLPDIGNEIAPFIKGWDDNRYRRDDDALDGVSLNP